MVTRSKRSRQSAVRHRFAPETIDALSKAKILGVRAGTEHRYTAVWVVVVEGRAFARSWTDAPTGWFRAFRVQPLGSIKVGTTTIDVRAAVVRSPRLRDLVSAAFAEKYDTKGSLKWVTGFAEPERASKTIEFTPV